MSQVQFRGVLWWDRQVWTQVCDGHHEVACGKVCRHYAAVEIALNERFERFPELFGCLVDVWGGREPAPECRREWTCCLSEVPGEKERDGRIRLSVCDLVGNADDVVQREQSEGMHEFFLRLVPSVD